MTTTACSERASIESPRRSRRSTCGSRRQSVKARPKSVAQSARSEAVLARYLDGGGRQREIVRCHGAAGSLLVVDRDRVDHADRRLVAHLAVDEPAANAQLICKLYLSDSKPARCRRMTFEDLAKPVPTELDGQIDRDATSVSASGSELCDRDGNRYCLAPVKARIAMPELRWRRTRAADEGLSETVSVREVVAALQRYEPARCLSAAAILSHRGGGRLSVSTLSVELERLNASRIVLNRGIREAVLAAMSEQQLSMSEIALRCGRVKRDRRGALSGETTWLSRRIGLVCEGGAAAPTPWIHSDVLALIARRGLGVAPRDVELA